MKDLNDSDNDERRLFYVALTRARKGVTITYSKQSDAGREQLPSQFITEIKKDLIEELETSSFERDLEEKKHILFSVAKSLDSARDKSLRDLEFVKNILEKNGLSVTALNNYLECPWNYFYSNLLRLPKAKNKHMMYGTAIHSALRDFFSQLKDREIPKENLLKSFEFYLNKESLNERDFDEVLEKGRKALSGYYDKYYKTWPRNVLTEFEIKGVVANIRIENKYTNLPVHLTGKLDKIEFLGSGNEVNVVDYKTRQPLSRNEIEKRGYKRQLVFYKLLLDNFGGKKSDFSSQGGSASGGKGSPSPGEALAKRGKSDFEEPKFKMVSGELDFIEPLDRARGLRPTEKGDYKKEKFIITDEDIKELKETIKRVTEEILNLKFWDTRCEEKDCQ